MPQASAQSDQSLGQEEPQSANGNEIWDDREGTGPIFFWRDWEEPHGYLCQFYLCNITNDSDAILQAPHGITAVHTFNCAEQYMMYHKALVLALPDSACAKQSAKTVSKPQLPPHDSLLQDRSHLWEAILAEPLPHKQKYLVRSIPFTEPQRKLWEKMKVDIVVQGTYYKFSQNPELREKLLSTGDRELFEAAPNDRVWGIGFAARNARKHTHRQRWGANLLGKALMNVRNRLQEENKKVPHEEGARSQ